MKTLGSQLGLPYPLPQNTAPEWRSISAETREKPLHLVEQWWLLAQSLPPAIQFVTPNKARSVKNAATQQWSRTPGHFLLKVRFGGWDPLVCKRCYRIQLAKH